MEEEGEEAEEKEVPKTKDKGKATNNRGKIKEDPREETTTEAEEEAKGEEEVEEDEKDHQKGEESPNPESGNPVAYEDITQRDNKPTQSYGQ